MAPLKVQNDLDSFSEQLKPAVPARHHFTNKLCGLIQPGYGISSLPFCKALLLKSVCVNAGAR